MGFEAGAHTFWGAVEEEGVDLVWGIYWDRNVSYSREEVVESFNDGGLGVAGGHEQCRE